MEMEQSLLLSQGSLKISCRLSQPDDGCIDRVVLGVHGFGGSADDQIQSGIAEEMALFSAATVRFDFPALPSPGLPGRNSRRWKTCASSPPASARM